MRRVTIADIARTAGVSKGAASHALNGRKGVSEATRARVVAAADDLGWTPNAVARALSGSRAGAIGWVIRRSPKSSSIDPFFMAMFGGVELGLADTPQSLVVKLVRDEDEEERVLRTWAAERRVDGVVLNDAAVADRRFPLLAELGLHGVLIGDVDLELPDHVGSVRWDHARAVGDVLDELRGHGHRRVGWISGPESLHSTRARLIAVGAYATEHQLLVHHAATDFSSDAGASAAETMLGSAEPPTAFVLDNELMALHTLTRLRRLGRRVPEDVSIVSWLDSELTQLSTPSITALRHDIPELGRMATMVLLAAVEGDPGYLLGPQPVLRRRGSTGPAPRRA